MMAWLRLALGNLRANRRRTGITLLSLTVGVAGLVFLWAFIDGINAQMINNMTGYVTGDLKVHARGFHKILTRQFPMGLPTELSDIGVVPHHGAGFDPEALKAVHAGSARHIIVLAADEADPYSDSLTFDIAHRLTELNLGSHTIVECVNDQNRGRFKALGVRTIIRPVRTYPEIMVRSVVAPGSEKVLEDLFNYEHDHPHRYELKLDDLNWADIVSALVRHGIGTALAYIDDDNEVICHPPTNEEIEGKGLIVLVKSTDTPEVSV